MTTRAVGAGAGIGWLKQAVNLGRNNPKAIFGGAALLLAVILALGIGFGLAAVLLGGAMKNGSVAMVALFVFSGVAMVVMAALIVGYLRLLDAVENGQPASAADVFAGFSDMAVSGRAIGFILLLAIAQNLLLALLISALAPGFGDWYLQNLQDSMAGVEAVPTIPTGFGAAMVIMWTIGLFGYAVQSIGLGQVALRNRGIGGALGDGVKGAAKNLLPLLVFLLVVVAAVVVLMLVVFLGAMLLGVVAKLLGGWVVALVGIPLYIAFILAMLVVMFGVMYFMWRDVCGDGTALAASSDDRIEL
ncbi:hypothetical protein [Thermomonas sp. HDW16]|uniref:hypothetical protein n=1 Tax=Thermomonas sp. HDW16 TaxID=2714945 RepID=UPI00140DC6DD|nr:hypothetical protein [Thermomonas sp. HDW16]QIL19509.1 hypothetical protein G7079_01495 [Thermomonas sp. HDW16]